MSTEKMASKLTIGSSSENSEAVSGGGGYYEEEWENLRGGGGEVREIGELTSEEEEAESVFSIDFQGRGEEIVYVAVSGKPREEKLSMDALIWTLNNAVIHPSSAFVFLIHCFPETKFIPTPLAKLPINQVNPEQKERYMAQERGKRRDYLQKFKNVCSASQVKVDTILIESGMEAKAILELISTLNIKKLVLGVTKSTARKMRSRKGNGVADQILQNAPEFCEVKIICEGKELSEVKVESSSPSPSPSPSPRSTDHHTPKFVKGQELTRTNSFSCGCFKIWPRVDYSLVGKALNRRPNLDASQPP